MDQITALVTPFLCPPEEWRERGGREGRRKREEKGGNQVRRDKYRLHTEV